MSFCFSLNVLELDDNLLGSFSPVYCEIIAITFKTMISPHHVKSITVTTNIQADVNFFDQLIKDHGLKLKLGRYDIIIITFITIITFIENINIVHHHHDQQHHQRQAS